MSGFNFKSQDDLKYWKQSCFIIAIVYFVNAGAALGQVGNAATPIVFNNGNTIDVSSLYPSITLTSYPVLSNSVQILGTGGTMTDNSNQAIGFLDPFTGTGVLTVNIGANNFIAVGSNLAYPATQEISSGLTLESGELYLGHGTTTLDGPFAVTGSSALIGNATITNNSVSGSSATTLSLDYADGDYSSSVLTFTGSGSGFDFNSNIDPNQPSSDIVGSIIVLNNTSGTQTFGGTIGDYVYRVGEGGTTVFTGSVEENLSVEGGTAVLSGANGAVTNPGNGNTAIVLHGGTLTLDNTSINNNNRIGSKFLEFKGGDLTLLGVNGGVTNQQIALPPGTSVGPIFGEGLNVITVTAGSGSGSSASLTFAGAPSISNSTGSVDFEGLGTNAQVFFTNQSEGAIGPYATFNGTDFASYDTTNGVVEMSASGRPAQVSSGTLGSYVLGTSSQTTLTANTEVTGVTMNAGESLDLGGNKLQLGAWIQNGSAGTISDGVLQFLSFSTVPNIYFTTNADLNLQVGLNAVAVVKNGSGNLNLTGSPDYGVYGTNQFPVFDVNAGTLTLNVTTAISNGSAGTPTFTVGDSAGTADSATLSLLANNQFYSGSSTGQLVSLKILPAGQFLMNGYNATVSSLEVDSGTVNTGGGTLTANSITANVVGSAGQIVGGAVNLVSASPTISVANLQAEEVNPIDSDGLIISSQITSSSALTKTGDGVLVLANSSNSFGNGTVGLIVSEGTVGFQTSNAAGSTNQQIQIANGAGLEGDTTGASVTVPNPVTVGTANFSGTPLILSGGVTQSSHGELNVTNTTTIDGYVNNLASSQSVDGKTGTGTLILSGQASGTSTGVFSQDDGILAFDSDTPLPTGMTLRITAGTIEAVNNAYTISNALDIVNDATFAGTEALTFSASTGNILSASSTQGIYVNDTAPVTINNLNANGSTLITGGTGTLVLAGNTTSLVATQIMSGTLEIQNPGAPGASLGTVTVSSPGTLNLNNYNATMNTLSGSGAVQLGTGNLTAFSGTFSGAVGGTGNLIKSGTGNLTLSGTNTYSGTTTVSQGTLQVDGSIGNSATTVNSGTKLQGTGTLGNVTMMSGSTLQAGDSAIQLNTTLTTGNLTFNTGATLQFKLNTSLGQSDTINVMGNLTLNNVNLVLNDLATSSNALTAGTQLTLFTYTGTESGELDFNNTAVANGSLITYGANTFEVQYSVGDPSVELTVESVPEPATWVLMLGGVALLLVTQRRKLSA